MRSLREAALSSTTHIVPQHSMDLLTKPSGEPRPGPDAQETIIYPNVCAAIEALRTHPNKSMIRPPRTGGPKYERNRSHVAYAWKTVERKVKSNVVSGITALHVLHATKGWKIVHGWNA